MKKVVNEWKKAWRKVRIDYEQKVKEISSSNPESLKILAKYVRKGALILEAGCGYGIWCIYLNKHQWASCVGIDIVKEHLTELNFYLKESPSHKTFAIAGDITKLPFHEGIFDAVTSFGVIEHFRRTSEVVEALNEASRVLRQRGFLILIIPNLEFTLRNKLVVALSKGRHGMYHKPYTRSALVSMFNMINSLRIVETGFTTFGLRGPTLNIVNFFSPKKVILFLYHATWRILNILLKRVSGEDYQNPIYIVASATHTDFRAH